MHALIVVAHPSESAFTHAVAAELQAGFVERAGASVEVADLVAEEFDPRFTTRDHARYNGRGGVDPALLAEQERIDRADRLVLVFPVYWWSMPALLKGWVDRVFTAGWAFDEAADGKIEKRLLGLKGHLVAIVGAGPGTYERRGYDEAIRTQIVDGIFDFCGIDGTLDLLSPFEPEGAQDGLRRARLIGAGLAEGAPRPRAR